MLYKIILGKIKSAILMGLVMGLASSVMGSEIIKGPIVEKKLELIWIETLIIISVIFTITTESIFLLCMKT